MDRDYNNVLSYTESGMISLLNQNRVASASDFSFIRNNGTLIVDIKYEICLTANYIAFQNPDYSNKWFFAWIDDVQYIGENSTQISYTVDSWSTWFEYWNAKPCFIVREHVNNDNIGSHLVDEGLNTGECVQVGYAEEDISLSQFGWVAVMSSWNPEEEKQFEGISIINGNVFGKQIYLIKAEPISNLKNLLLLLLKTNSDGHIDDISDVFIVPRCISR